MDLEIKYPGVTTMKSELRSAGKKIKGIGNMKIDEFPLKSHLNMRKSKTFSSQIHKLCLCVFRLKMLK